MQRRTFMTAALATAVLSLAGCAAQTRADTDMPAEAFTPEGARRYLAKCRTARDAIQAEGRASLTGPKSPARASAAMTAAALSRVDDGSGGYRQPLAQPRHRGRTASDLEATGPSHPDMDLDARTDVRFRVLGVLR
ncbi:hypothetical protein [Sutterella wadsworthensis]